MAASRRVAMKSIVKMGFLKPPINPFRNQLFRSSSIDLSTEEVKYPPVRPKYPPGIWGEIAPKKAWQLYEGRDMLLSKPTAKWRLEEMAGELPGKTMWLIHSVDAQPGTLPYKRYLTKTHMERVLPDLYNTSQTQGHDNLQRLLDRVRSQVEDVVLIEKELCLKQAARALVLGKKDSAYYRHRAVRQIFDVLINNASYDAPHLLEAQVTP